MSIGATQRRVSTRGGNRMRFKVRKERGNIRIIKIKSSNTKENRMRQR